MINREKSFVSGIVGTVSFGVSHFLFRLQWKLTSNIMFVVGLVVFVLAVVFYFKKDKKPTPGITVIDTNYTNIFR